VDLKVEARRTDGAVVLEVGGEVDVQTAPALRDALEALDEAAESVVVVDMTEVEFLDSTGLGVLVSALQRARTRDARLGLVIAQERVLKLFNVTGLSEEFEIFSTIDEAQAGLGATR
jgi:anti-sigma B factor antagonist